MQFPSRSCMTMVNAYMVHACENYSLQVCWKTTEVEKNGWTRFYFSNSQWYRKNQQNFNFPKIHSISREQYEVWRFLQSFSFRVVRFQDLGRLLKTLTIPMWLYFNSWDAHIWVPQKHQISVAVWAETSENNQLLKPFFKISQIRCSYRCWSWITGLDTQRSPKTGPITYF